jgi:Domain of unknown function (DUF4114)
VKAKTLILLNLALIGISSQSYAQTPSSIVSYASPYKLDIAGPVMLAGSDAAAADFQKNILPGFQKIVSTSLKEYQNISQLTLTTNAIDPNKLRLGFDTTARVYFVGEGTGFSNSLGYTTTGNGPISTDAELIFPNASSQPSKKIRTATNPLLPGDFVDLGEFKKGTNLEFFIVQDGAKDGKRYFSTNKSLNSDGLVHAISLAPNGSPFLLFGFEDLVGGGDKDYNDVLFAVYIGTENVKNFAALGAPEPTLAVGSLLALGMIFGHKLRQ